MTPREKNIAILTGVAVGALALNTLFVTPLMDRWTEAENRAQVAAEELMTAEQIFQNDLRAQRRWREIAGSTLQTNASQAESQALNHVREWAQQSGLNLTFQRPERIDSERGFGRITVRASGTGNTAAVSQFLWAVQTSEIPVRVVDVTINTRREGTDDLTMQIGLATIYEPPASASAAAGRAEVTR